MPHSCERCSASEKFEWEIRFYQRLLLPHTELADRASEAECILSERVRQANGRLISAPEREALDDAHQHLRKIQVFQLGFPEIAGEFVKEHSLGSRNQIDQPSRDLTGRPISLSGRRHLWNVHAE